MPKIRINNIELYYEEYGKGPQPIIFIHGFLASSKMWKAKYMTQLPEQYHAYAIDMRGHGRSHMIRHGCNLKQMADDVAQFIHSLQLAKCVFVGVSMGGAIGAQLALDHQEVLRALILMNPGLGSVTTGKYSLLHPFLSLLADKPWFLKRLVRSMSGNSLSQDSQKGFLDEAMLVSRETWSEYMHPSNRIRDLSRFRQVNVPVLVMIGGEDRVIPLNIQHRLADSIPHTEKIVFENAGHGMVGQISDQVLKKIISFLEQAISPNDN